MMALECVHNRYKCHWRLAAALFAFFLFSHAAYASSLFDVEQAIRTGQHLRAKAMLSDMEKQGFAHEDVTALLYFSELSAWESKFRQEADAFDRLPNQRTYELTQAAWGMLSGADVESIRKAKVSSEMADSLIARLDEDRDRYSRIQGAFAGRSEEAKVAERKAEAEQEAAAKEKSARASAEHDAKIKADAQRRHADLVAFEELRKFCGGEPGQPRIGMPVSKLTKCVPGMQVIQQINRADGVLSIMLGPAYRVDTIGGYVVAWKSRW